MVGGDNATLGRIEIYYNMTWGTICLIGWTEKDSDVLCRQLGYERALLFHGQTYSNFPRGTGQVNLNSDLRSKSDRYGRIFAHSQISYWEKIFRAVVFIHR